MVGSVTLNNLKYLTMKKKDELKNCHNFIHLRLAIKYKAYLNLHRIILKHAVTYYFFKLYS